MSVPNSNEPANHPILRTRSDKQEIASSTHDNYEQLPKNFVRQSSLTENGQNFENDNMETASSSSHGTHAANYINSLRIAFDNSNEEDSFTSVSERVAKMLESAEFSDVVFIVGKNEETIFAHKFVLSIGSEVFGTMLNSKHFPSQSSKENPLQQVIRIEDIEPDIFKIILGFLYTDKVELNLDNVMFIMYASRKYAINALQNACIKYLKDNLCPENALVILKQAKFFDLEELFDASMQLINHDATQIFQSEKFIEIDRETLSAILQNDRLRIKEIVIFKTVIRWAEVQCKQRGIEINDANLRDVLGNLLFQIRFPLMTLEEFAAIAQFSNILSDSEKVDLFVYFISPIKPAIPFVNEKRCEVFGKEISINRFQRIESRWGYTGTTDKIKFTVDANIYLTAIGLYGSMQGENSYEVQIKIIDFGSNRIIASNDTSFKSNGTSDPFKVSFKDPVEINAGTTYIISSLLKGPDSWFGSKGLRRISRQTISGNSSCAITFQFSYAAGNNNGTSVDDGQIPELFFCTKMS